jgi:hypothetical protein
MAAVLSGGLSCERMEVLELPELYIRDMHITTYPEFRDQDHTQDA